MVVISIRVFNVSICSIFRKRYVLHVYHFWVNFTHVLYYIYTECINTRPNNLVMAFYKLILTGSKCMSPCKEYFKKVDTDYVVFCKKISRNYIIRMLRCRRHTHTWNVGRYWSSNLISFIFYIVLEYLAARLCNICKHLNNKCLILKPCDICSLIYNLYVSSF